MIEIESYPWNVYHNTLANCFYIETMPNFLIYIPDPKAFYKFNQYIFNQSKN